MVAMPRAARYAMGGYTEGTAELLAVGDAEGDGMRFRVERTSEWGDLDEDGDAKPPCEGVTIGEYVDYDIRTCKSIDEFNAHVKEDWLSRGENHGHTEEGLIKREFRRKCWVLEIANIAELLEFSKKHGTLVVEVGGGDTPCLEIYDSYRE